jgi:hypothetical protein
MKTLVLNPEEERILAEVLERHVHDLDMEVAHTDSREFREMLRHRRDVLSHMQGRVQSLARAV